MSPIGKKVKHVRQMKQLTQRELAKGICTQSLISYIEKDKTTPTVDVIYKIAKKLSVPIEYFFDSHETSFDYVKEVLDTIKQKMSERKYEEVLEICLGEEKNPLFNRKQYYQFLLWRKGVCTYYVYNDSNQSIHLLKEALTLTCTTEEPTTDTEIDILISLGIIFYETKHFKQSKKMYDLAYHSLNEKRADVTLQLRLYYNYSKVLTSLEDYYQSITYCQRGVQLCKSQKTFYSFGELYFQWGLNLLQLQDKAGLQYLEKSKQIFTMLDHEEFANVCDEEMKQHSF